VFLVFDGCDFFVLFVWGGGGEVRGACCPFEQGIHFQLNLS